jgi:hypothetical protein
MVGVQAMMLPLIFTSHSFVIRFRGRWFPHPSRVGGCKGNKEEKGFAAPIFS